MIPRETIAEIKDRLSIVMLINEYVPLKSVGGNHKGLCPFHQEKTPSFVVSDEKKIFHCFGCGKGGNIFTFLQEREGLSFPQAVQKCAERLGLKVHAHVQKTPQEQMFRVNKFAALYYYNALQRSKVARDYLDKRGITAETAEAFRLGWADLSRTGLKDYFANHDVPLPLGIELGLLKEKDNSEFHDRFHSRIIFPIFDSLGRIIGFGGRSLDDRYPPKYLNSPESRIYQKGSHLYGFHLNKTYVQKEDLIVIVEGYFDLISLFQHGVRFCGATLGTALTEEHLNLIKRYTKNCVMLFDSDDAGVRAAQRSLPLFLKHGFYPRIALLPQGTDPDLYVQKFGVDALLNLIKTAQPLFNFCIEQLKEKTNPNYYAKLQVFEKVKPLFELISDPFLHEELIKQTSAQLFIDEYLLRTHLSLATRIQRSEPLKEQTVLQNSPLFQSEKIMMELIVKFPPLFKLAQTHNLRDYLTHPTFREIYIFIEKKYLEGVTLEEGLDDIEDINLRSLLTRLVLQPSSVQPETAEQVFIDGIMKLKADKLKLVEKQLLEQIKKCEGEKKENRTIEVLQKYQQLIQNERKLMNREKIDNVR